MVASTPCFSIYIKLVIQIRMPLVAKIIHEMFHTCLVEIIGNFAY